MHVHAVKKKELLFIAAKSKSALQFLTPLLCLSLTKRAQKSRMDLVASAQTALDSIEQAGRAAVQWVGNSFSHASNTSLHEAFSNATAVGNVTGASRAPPAPPPPTPLTCAKLVQNVTESFAWLVVAYACFVCFLLCMMFGGRRFGVFHSQRDAASSPGLVALRRERAAAPAWAARAPWSSPRG